MLTDFSQAPSGAGYALENRTVISKVFPSLYRDSAVHRLAPFFRTLRSSLAAAAPVGVDDPRVVLLTPGPLNEAYFDHAHLATVLGYPLVQGGDLTVRNGRVWLRALGGLDWRIQRLALEDVRRLPQRLQPDAPGLPPPTGPEWRVCLRSYTFFYVPWRRVYIDLDATGALTIGGGVLPLDQECWSAPFPESPYPFAVGQPVP